MSNYSFKLNNNASYSHSWATNGMNSWLWLKGRMEHLYGATVAGKLKYWTRNKLSPIKMNSKKPAHDSHWGLISDLKRSYRPLFIPLPDTKWVLEDGVHDSADAKRGLDYIRNNLLHCGKTEVVVFPQEQHTVLLNSHKARFDVTSYHARFSGTSSHWPCLWSAWKFCPQTQSWTSYRHKHSINKSKTWQNISTTRCTAVISNYPVSLRSFSWFVM